MCLQSVCELLDPFSPAPSHLVGEQQDGVLQQGAVGVKNKQTAQTEKNNINAKATSETTGKTR